MKNFLLTLMLASHGLMAHAAGTIQPRNFIGTPVQLYQGSGSTVPVPVTAHIVYGVFWGTNRDALTLALPLGSNSTTSAGIIVAPSVYAITGTVAGQTVYLQIKGWPAAYGMNWMAAQNSFADFGQTPIVQATLGPETGPGAVIWQSTSGTNPNRFYPLTLGVLLTPPLFVSFGFPPMFSTVVDEGSQGVVNVIFTVNRFANGPPSNLDSTSTVLLSTTDMTAVGGQDYVPTNVLVTFGPRETVREVRIQVTGDALPEPDEQFGIRLIPTSSVIGGLGNLVVTIREARVASVRIDANHALVSIPTTSSQRYALESSPDRFPGPWYRARRTSPAQEATCSSRTLLNPVATPVSIGCKSCLELQAAQAADHNQRIRRRVSWSKHGHVVNG